VNPPDAIEGGTRHGLSGFEQAELAFRRAYSSMEIDIERQVESGDVVGLVTRFMVQGRGSGIEIPQRIGLLFTFRDGRLARLEWSNDPEGLLARLSDDAGDRGKPA
jgi:hypothetical protein